MKKVLSVFLIAAAGAAFGQSSSPFKYLDLPNGQRQIVPQSDTRAAQQGQQIWNQATSNTASGQVEIARTTSVPNPSGGSVPATATGRLPSAAVAVAVGRVASVAAKSLFPIQVGFIIYDLAKELGFTFGRDSAGNDTYSKTDSDGYLYFYGSSVKGTAAATCKQLVDDRNANSQSSGVWIKFVLTQSRGYPYADCRGDTVYQNYPVADYNQTNVYLYGLEYSKIVGPLPVTPSTRQEFLDAVSAKSGWPVDSKVNDVILADPQPELQAPQGITASGPASSQGPTSTTNNTTNNTTTKNNTTYNNSYAGDTITTNVSNVSITTNNSTGAVTNSETTTSTPPVLPAAANNAPSTPNCGLPGSPACKLDETGTPDGKNAFDPAKTDIDNAKTSAETNIGNAAKIAAPSWSFSFQLPTGCAPYVTGIKGVVLNVCQYQSTIHGLLSAIWAAATIFAMIGMVGRTIRES